MKNIVKDCIDKDFAYRRPLKSRIEVRVWRAPKLLVSTNFSARFQRRHYRISVLNSDEQISAVVTINDDIMSQKTPKKYDGKKEEKNATFL